MADADKTEAPTPKRKREARQKGQIPRSPELSTWATVLLASYVLPSMLGGAGERVRDVFDRTGDAMAAPTPASALGLVGPAAGAVLGGVMPLAVAMCAFGIVTNVAQTGGVVSTKKLKPSFDRLNPLKGFKRMFGAESAWNTVKVLAKTGALALAAWVPLRGAVTRLSSADQPPLPALVTSVGRDGLEMIRLVAVAGLLLGIADYVVMRRRINKSLKMTKQEVKDEHRQSEGDPHMKGQIRARAREISRNRMIAAVADASVVIVNPTHVAVALRYSPGEGAPRLVAKGRDAVATRIRAAAEEHKVPMVRDIPLARALHDACELDQPVPADLYAAVAKVLAFVMTAGKRAASMGGIVSLAR